MVELIERKRDGGHLSPTEVRWLIAEYSADRIPSYQMAAMTMAIYLRGLSTDELGVWTEAMMHSGEVLDLSSHPLPKVDKHSTGGVGDKVSIPLAPMVAACGVAVPMISGRGLGHTGGTLDKLESIPGFTTTLEPSEFTRILGELNLFMVGQSETLVPADRRLYALRDVTGTVSSIPLISSSIMSKKLAEDLDALVLDVKFGNGAFMSTLEQAGELARTMLAIGEAHGTAVSALLTDMSQPLGREVGNSNEIVESLAVLRGEGPADLTELTLALGAEMLLLAGVATGEDEARRQLCDVVADGRALELFADVVAAQGGKRDALYDTSLLPQAANRHVVRSTITGTVSMAHARRIGTAAMRLGAGRANLEDRIDHGVGITVMAKVGDSVDAGGPLAEIAWNEADRLDDCLAVLEGAWEFADGAQAPVLIRETLRTSDPTAHAG